MIPTARPPIRLDRNTTPFLNESAILRALRAMTPWDLAMYPEPGAPALTRAIADRVRFPVDRVLLGNGSDEILDLAMRALVPRGGSIGVIEPSFGMYDHFARACGVDVRRVPARDTLPVDALAALRADAYFVPSPNNPTGAAFPRAAFEGLLDRVDAPVVIDEAYAEFARQDLRSLAAGNERAIVTRTFSKAYGVPGIRVGYALGPPDLLDPMRRIRMPYNLSAWSERAALAALEDGAFVDRAVAFVTTERARLTDAIGERGWPVWPSRANFVFVGPLRRGAEVHDALRDRGVLVKLVDWPGGAEGRSLRITIGTRDQDDALLRALEEVSAWRA